MTVEKAASTNRKREVLKKVDSSVAWSKKVNLMSPSDVDKLYDRIQQVKNRRR